MKIGVFSDTHDHLEPIQKAIEIFKNENIELLIHCGDWVSPFTLEFFDANRNGLNVEVKSVFGNNEGDIKRILERNAELNFPITFSSKISFPFEIDGRKVIIFHGHDRTIFQALIDCQTYDVIFTGHTHIVRNEVIGTTLVLNPGSLSYARESKIIDEASIAIYDTQNNTAEIKYLS